VIGALETMAAKGIRERVLNPALRKQGLSVRKARAAINVVFDSIKEVIEECAYRKMPEDSRRQFDACLEWFARWTQRVIPKAVYSEAMQQAKKTLGA
jgi:hypothetical protein